MEHGLLTGPVFEVFLDRGTRSATTVFYPTSAVGAVDAEGGECFAGNDGWRLRLRDRECVGIVGERAGSSCGECRVRQVD